MGASAGAGAIAVADTGAAAMATSAAAIAPAVGEAAKLTIGAAGSGDRAGDAAGGNPWTKGVPARGGGDVLCDVDPTGAGGGGGAGPSCGNI